MRDRLEKLLPTLSPLLAERVREEAKEEEEVSEEEEEAAMSEGEAAAML